MMPERLTLYKFISQSVEEEEDEKKMNTIVRK